MLMLCVVSEFLHYASSSAGPGSGLAIDTNDEGSRCCVIVVRSELLLMGLCGQWAVELQTHALMWCLCGGIFCDGELRASDVSKVRDGHALAVTMRGRWRRCTTTRRPAYGIHLSSLSPDKSSKTYIPVAV